MTPAAPLSPLEDDDLLHEILLRLPPQPCSLPRASAVCRRWLGLITDRKFTARFRAHHRKPPLLGVFHRSDSQGIAFTPLLDPPHRIPTLRIDLRRRYKDYNVLSCRHGRVLAMNPRHTKLLVCDPITGKRCRVAVPRVFSQFRQSRGSVLCDDRAQYHVHGGCHSGHFKVVLMTEHTEGFIPIACIYSSKTKTWGKIMSTAAPSEHRYYGYDFPGVLIGNALYWLLSVGMGRDMLVLDLYEQSLAVIAWPLITSEFQSGYRRIVEAEDGAVGLAILSYPRFRIWQRNANLHGVSTWEIWKTIDMNNIPGIPRNVANYE
ncbi:uncharacterized protein [Lolium perenne]|uniref:uncharacterized protein n=1 Tax=Lolium perenne TaxID=4522 RepID=UPI0021F5819C|nr:F-box protein At5g49610-like [Lolium perenne]